MAGFGAFLGHVAAGAMQGAGLGLQEDVKRQWEKAKEDATQAHQLRLADIQHGQTMQRDATRRQHETSERLASQDYESGRDRAKWAREDETAGDLHTAEDGSVVRVHKGKGSTVTGPDGKPLRLRQTPKDGSTPADVATAEWLIRQGVAKDATEAWDKVRRARDNPNSRARLVLDTFKALKEDARDRRSDVEKRREAETIVDGILAGEDGAVAPAAPGNQPSAAGGAATAPAAAPAAPARRPFPRTADDARREFGTGIPAAPRDPSQREVGKTYLAPDGRKVKWRGTGWQVVP